MLLPDSELTFHHLLFIFAFVQPKVAHAQVFSVFAVFDIGDILAVFRPRHAVPALLHFGKELPPRVRQRHASVDLGAQSDLPTAAGERRAVLSRTQVRAFLFGIVGRQNRQSLLGAKPVTLRPQRPQEEFVGVELASVVQVVGVDDEMIVKPTLSREKCVCLQNLNKILCVLDNKSQSDIYRQSVQKEFKRFFIFGF